MSKMQKNKSNPANKTSGEQITSDYGYNIPYKVHHT